ncbi:MAG: DUF5615 family PIN-like protein [Lewinellaceae bacterium]|nr:DUF5615 family PIN-like protein [Phaeodactylibacter sp.]MCB9036940.1 DUF5615 family PIN-like protein [Lewinellaceae bacterium]
MTIREFQFLTDENIDEEVADFLRNEGFDVFDIKEEGLFRMPDKDILKLAFEQRRVVISQDSDFGTLIFRDEVSFFGVIYLRPGHYSPEVHIQTLRVLLSTNIEYSIPFILVGENEGGKIKFRLRKL